MPKNIGRFAWLYWAACLIDIAGLPPLYDESWTGQAVAMQAAVIAAIVLFTLVINFPFFWLIVWKRRNWARWMMLVTSVVLLPLNFVGLEGEPLPLVFIAVGLLSSLVQALALYFLFTGDAREWFNRKIPQ